MMWDDQRHYHLNLLLSTVSSEEDFPLKIVARGLSYFRFEVQVIIFIWYNFLPRPKN